MGWDGMMHAFEMKASKQTAENSIFHTTTTTTCAHPHQCAQRRTPKSQTCKC